MDRPLRFHWSLSQAGDKLRRAQATVSMSGLFDPGQQIAACRQAERNGIESMLMAIGFTRPDPLQLAIAIGLQTEKIKFMVACRSGLISPTFYVQQINTASAILPGRILLNIVCGHTPHELRYYGDFLAHDARYRRTDEFLTVCRGLWSGAFPYSFQGEHYKIENARLHTPFFGNGAGAPEIFVGGNSTEAAGVAIQHGSCLWRFPAAPDALEQQVRPVLHHGTQVGLLTSIIARPTHDEALAVAAALVASVGGEARAVHQQFAARVDSEGFRSVYEMAQANSAWITPWLWAGAVPYLGAPSIALVGSFAEIADAMMLYKQTGITQFLLMGWPDQEEMDYFGSGVLPLVRAREQAHRATITAGDRARAESA
ncbi:MAG TPA: LLM class flavin-dependent oxidoreductase [Candidatus Angelobacter sp.]|nr:LLM class flavin-dependent oxidoreductase [Candidatus Angelobacter sp.]